MLTATMLSAVPWRAAITTRMGSEAMASRKPRPWLIALAISSPSVCGRSSKMMAVAVVVMMESYRLCGRP